MPLLYFSLLVNTIQACKSCSCFKTQRRLEPSVPKCTIVHFVQMNGCVVSGVQLKVSVARRQPTLESVTASANTAATDNSSASWSSIGMYQSV